jgi:DNA polymerase-4
MDDRIILHCDLNGFFAAVECVLNPSLKEVPMAVCGDPEKRHGIILAKNELAKKFKIETAETIWQAKKKCPELVLVTPHHGEYEKYSRLVNQIYARFTDLVEPFGIDESWLDVTGSTYLFGDGEKIANTIRKTVKEELGLTVSVGVSFNKVFAKLGSDYKKPDATTVISRETGKKVVFPLPVNSLLYVGKAANKVLAELGITTIGALAKADREFLVSKLGLLGGQIHDYANGKDDSPVASILDSRDVKSIGNGTTFSHDLISLEDIKAGIIMLADSVGTRLRKQKVKCCTLQVTIRDPAFKNINRQKQLETATNSTKQITDIAMQIIEENWKIGNPIRMLTVTAGKLIDKDKVIEQISLFDKEKIDNKKQEKIECTIDEIREKYGHNTVKLAVTMKK